MRAGTECTVTFITLSDNTWFGDLKKILAVLLLITSSFSVLYDYLKLYVIKIPLHVEDQWKFIIKSKHASKFLWKMHIWYIPYMPICILHIAAILLWTLSPSFFLFVKSKLQWDVFSPNSKPRLVLRAVGEYKPLNPEMESAIIRGHIKRFFLGLAMAQPFGSS